MQYEFSDKVRLRPWVGTNYEEGQSGIRILVLGESHYGTREDQRVAFTEGVVRHLGQQHRNSYFTCLAKILTGKGAAENLNMKTRARVWEEVAFYNFIQEILPAARVRPTPEQIHASTSPFCEVLAILRPHLLLVTGHDLWDWLPGLATGPRLDATVAFAESEGHRSLAVRIRHPSAWGSPYSPAIEHLEVTRRWLQSRAPQLRHGG